jgi:tetratricopeptide (TPR) repeat protein
MQRALLSTLLLVCLAVPAAWGQGFTRSHRQAASELLDLMEKSQDLAETASALIDAQVRANPQIEPFRDILVQWTQRYINWDAMGPRMIELYLQTFTEGEIRDLLAFYRTPTGRKALEKLPVLMQEGMKIGEEAAQQHRGELDAMIRNRTQELQREGKKRETSRGSSGVGSPTNNQVADGWLARANAYYDKGMWNDAKSAFLGYLGENPNDVNAIADLGVCYKELGDHDRALNSFNRALVLNPGHWQSLYNKIIVLGFHLDRKDEARKLMRDLQKLQPDHPDVRRLAEDVSKLN